jgi:hypothetical protein
MTITPDSEPPDPATTCPAMTGRPPRGTANQPNRGDAMRFPDDTTEYGACTTWPRRRRNDERETLFWARRPSGWHLPPPTVPDMPGPQRGFNTVSPDWLTAPLLHARRHIPRHAGVTGGPSGHAVVSNPR